MILSPDDNPTDRQIRRFHIGMGAALSLLAAYLFVGFYRRTYAFQGWRAVAVVLAIGLALSFLMIPRCAPGVGRWIYWHWMKFGAVLGRINSAILLTVLYFTLLPLFTLFNRKDPLGNKIVGRTSYWHKASVYSATLDRMRRSF